jgi:hypothetical protein
MSFEAHYEREGSPGWPLKSWDDANALLGYQKADGPSYSAFTLPSGSYVQCAGGKRRLVVEARVTGPDASFRHYRFGKGARAGHDEAVACNCGPITADASDILTMRDARLIIRHFVEQRGELLGKYQANDVTHLFV